MSWNYRVLRKDYPDGDSTCHIHEVYYDDNGKIELWSVEPDDPFGITLEDLRGSVEHMLQAFEQPVLKEEEQGGKTALVEVIDSQDGASG